MPFNNRYGRRALSIPFLLIAVVTLLVFGGVVMLLWNAVLPAVLHVTPLTYRQAVLLLALCRILFGNFNRYNPSGSRGFNADKKKAWREKLMRMTPEERERFREQWKSRCRQQNK